MAGNPADFQSRPLSYKNSTPDELTTLAQTGYLPGDVEFGDQHDHDTVKD